MSYMIEGGTIFKQKSPIFREHCAIQSLPYLVQVTVDTYVRFFPQFATIYFNYR
jgi:hypothetical protein